MSDTEKKVTYIQSSEHAIIGESGGQAAVLAPGERVLFNEEADSHKYLKSQIEAEDESVAHLSLVEVSPKAEKAAKKERDEMLVEAEKIAAEARAEQARAASDQQEERMEAAEDQSPHSDPTDFPPQDEEAQRIARQSGAAQRATTQEDVVEDDKPRSKRSSSKSKSDGE